MNHSKSILVTGGAGYIGSHVVKQLLEETDHEVTILDNLSTGHMKTLETLEAIAHASGRGALRFYRIDLADFAAVAKLFMTEHFDAVMHFAASIVVPESVENPLKYYMNNTVNTIQLVSLCEQHGVPKFIFSSTAAVYGEPKLVNSQSSIVDSEADALNAVNSQSSMVDDKKQTINYQLSTINEAFPTLPINPYGRSKLMSETVIRDTAAASDTLEYVILRYFNVAGADINGNVELKAHSKAGADNAKLQPRIGQSFPNATHLIKVAAQTATGEREKMYIFGDDYDTPDGSCIRDYIHVDDLASAHLRALEYLDETTQDPTPNIFNVGYGHGASVKEVVDTMKQVSGVDFQAEEAPRRTGDPATLVADNRRAKEVLKWEPEYDDLALICETTLAWERHK